MQALRPVVAIASETGRRPVGLVVGKEVLERAGLRGWDGKTLCACGVHGGRTFGEGRGAVAVEQHVVHAVVPVVPAVIDAQRRRFHEAVGEEVERAAELLVHPHPGGGLGIVVVPEVQVQHLIAQFLVEVLQRGLGRVVGGDEPDHRGAELAGHLPADVGQQFGVEIAEHLDVLRDRERGLRDELLGEPHAALRSRQRDQAFTDGRHARRCGVVPLVDIVGGHFSSLPGGSGHAEEDPVPRGDRAGLGWSGV
ncbi:hypothetical protein GONAM_52_00320 [Gordonia namibiensis NBRC 108229]|uniref:Uncharacterized protein n=1 Tax=Gordonia namibiensis NBRC 108229 TaxID=1208314 RepID=K6WSB5_9ACTN|nr:hypothetical protein GONAM_52_00320 [Gordonia namibiensis NBRC 108229]